MLSFGVVQNFRDLKVWRRAHALTLLVYRLSSVFPDSERFGLTSQTRRAASSIGANIAEGAGRASNPDLARFFHNAVGSANELENHLLLARDLNFLPQHQFEEVTRHLDELQRMLATLISRVRAEN